VIAAATVVTRTTTLAFAPAHTGSGGGGDDENDGDDGGGAGPAQRGSLAPTVTTRTRHQPAQSLVFALPSSAQPPTGEMGVFAAFGSKKAALARDAAAAAARLEGSYHRQRSGSASLRQLSGAARKGATMVGKQAVSAASTAKKSIFSALGRGMQSIFKKQEPK
jgi:hypothetical protein